MNKKSRWLSVTEFAMLMGRSKTVVWHWLKAGIVPGAVKREGSREGNGNVVLGYWDIPESALAMIPPPKGKRGNPGGKRGKYKSHMEEYAFSPSRIAGSEEEARRKFNGSLKTFKIGFDELKEKILNGENFTQIAKEGGVTRERVRQIWKAYFSGWIGEGKRSGWELSKGRTKVRRERRVKEMAMDDWGLERLIVLGEENGVEVRPIAIKSSMVQVVKGMIEAEGKECVVAKALISGSVSRYSDREYWRAYVTRERAERGEFFILVVDDPDDPESVFIIPREVMVEWMGDKEAKSLYVRVDKNRRVYRNMLPEVEWRMFEKRWDLLKGEGGKVEGVHRRDRKRNWRGGTWNISDDRGVDGDSRVEVIR